MIKTFLIGTVDNRISSLLNMLVSARRYIGPWEFVIVAQHYTASQQRYVLDKCAALFGDQAGHIHFDFMPDYMGCFGSKMYGMKNHDSDIWLSMDDDMLILPQTNFDRMADIYAADRSLGMISGAYCRFPGKTKTHIRRMRDKLVPEPILGTWGGLMFGRELGDLFVSERYGRDIQHDDLEWSMLSYVNGYENARYLGSLIVHMVGSKGGFRLYAKGMGAHELPDPSLIRVEFRENDLDNPNAMVYVGSLDLLPRAHELHRHNKRLRLG